MGLNLQEEFGSRLRKGSGHWQRQRRGTKSSKLGFGWARSNSRCVWFGSAKSLISGQHLKTRSFHTEIQLLWGNWNWKLGAVPLCSLLSLPWQPWRLPLCNYNVTAKSGHSGVRLLTLTLGKLLASRSLSFLLPALMAIVSVTEGTPDPAPRFTP